MDYLVTFLEGVVTFVSPCLLPLLPVYVAYFAGVSNAEDDSTRKLRRTVVNALGFVLGFTVIFVELGAFAGALGGLLSRYQTALNVVCGIVVILFGLSFMGAVNIPALQRSIKPRLEVLPQSFPAAVVFGVVFAIGWTPCVGVYLGSALMLASTQGSALHGMGLLLAYSLGLGVPFLLAAVAIDKLSEASTVIKRHYGTINIACGVLLVLVGVLMATGQMNVWMAALAMR